MSKYFSLTTYRNKYRHTVVFENGNKVDDIKEDIKRGEKKHGTKIVFVPNKTFLGSNAELPFDRFVDWVDDMTYLINPRVKFLVDGFDGMESIFHKKYKAKPFSEYIKKILAGKSICDPISFSGDEVIEEEVTESIIDKSNKVKQKKKVMKKDIHLDVTFTYEDDLATVYSSFCNYTFTPDGGVHVDSVEDVICRFLQSKTKATMTEKEREKWDITWADVKEGLKLCINLSTNAQVQFMGNAKSRIQNTELSQPIKKIVKEKLEEFASKHDSTITAMCKFIKANARARIEASKTRQASKKTSMDRMDEFLMTNYVGCNNKGKAYKELYLVEGSQSAMGPVVSGRFSTDFQAAFGFRGNTKNPYKHDFYQIMENNEWKSLIKILRCGIGPSFDLSKLYFDKIIILTDADVDGFYISMGILSFFVMYLPKVVEDGRLYKVFPPLYKIDDKKHQYIINNSELQELFMKKIAKVYKIDLDKVGKLGKEDLSDFLYDTEDYLLILKDLSKYFKVPEQIIEIVASTFVDLGIIRSDKDFDSIPKAIKDPHVVGELMSRVQEKFPECVLKGNRINGPMNGVFRSLELNDRFPIKITQLIPIYSDWGSTAMITEKQANPVRMSLSEFLTRASAYKPKKLSRYKGLGEGTADMIGETTMNPENQMLVRFTMEDGMKALEMFHKLQSTKPKYAKMRKEMMEAYRIDVNNIDT